MLEITLESYDDLTEDEKASVPDNGAGKDMARYLRVKHYGTTILLKSDAMEPEDCVFYQDLYWIKEAIEQAYKLGIEDTEKLFVPD